MAPSLLCRLCSVLRGWGAFILLYKTAPRRSILLCSISYCKIILTVYDRIERMCNILSESKIV